MTDVLYTTTDKIRAVLGVSDTELTDAQITNLSVAEQLELKLNKLYPDHVALKAVIDATTATDEQKLIWKNILLWCQFAGAVCMLPSVQFWIAQKITDGDVEMQRFQKDNLQDTIDRITGMQDQYANEINPDVGGAGASTTLFSIVEPDYDPVTNA